MTPFSDPAHPQKVGLGMQAGAGDVSDVNTHRTESGLSLTDKANRPQKAGLPEASFSLLSVYISGQEPPNPGSLPCQANIFLILKGGTQLVRGPILLLLQIFLFYWHERR